MKQLTDLQTELLEALEALVEHLEETEDIEHAQFGCDDEKCCMCNARKAIARAKGE